MDAYPPLPRFSMNSSCVGLSPSTMSVMALMAMRGTPNIVATCAMPAASISFTEALFASR